MAARTDISYEELDSRCFKAFLAAAQNQNFTLAARQACMTQSGVSQHISRLEAQVRVPLFKRFGRKITLTAAGRHMVRHVKERADLTAAFLESIRDEAFRLSGLVAYAMPPACLLSPHFPLLLERRTAHPEIALQVHIVSSSRVEEMIVDSDIDFGFINEPCRNPALQCIPFCREEYIVVGAGSRFAQPLTAAQLSVQRFIGYPGNDRLLSLWFQHHCPGNRWRRPGWQSAGFVGQIHGAVAMAQYGVGLLAIPRHCVQQHLDSGALREVRLNRAPLLNEIHIVKLAKHVYPRRVEQVIEWFLDMKNPHPEGSRATSPQSRRRTTQR